MIQADLNDGLERFFADSRFDYVVMSPTWPAMRRADILLEEMQRVGKQGITTVPDMACWKGRLQPGLRSLMPVIRSLPNNRFDTPNNHRTRCAISTPYASKKISISWNEQSSITLIVKVHCYCGCFEPCLVRLRVPAFVEMECKSAAKRPKILIIF